MALISGKKIFQRNQYLILMPDIVIAFINTLGGDKPNIIILIDKHGRLIVDIETPRVGADLDERDWNYQEWIINKKKRRWKFQIWGRKEILSSQEWIWKGKIPPNKSLRLMIPRSHKIQV